MTCWPKFLAFFKCIPYDGAAEGVEGIVTVFFLRQNTTQNRQQSNPSHVAPPLPDTIPRLLNRVTTHGPTFSRGGILHGVKKPRGIICNAQKRGRFTETGRRVGEHTKT